MEPIILSNSKIKLYKRCTQAYYYREVELIVPKTASLPLQRGVMLHSMLEAYYKGKSWKKALEKYQPFWDGLMDEEKEVYGGDLMEECKRIMNGYIRLYGKKPQEKVHFVEMNFSENPIEILPNIYFKGVIDAGLEDDRGLWITEHKTHKKIPKEDQRFFDLQTAIYHRVAEIKGYKPTGVMWNYLITKPPTIPRLLKNGGLSRAKNIVTDRYTYLEAIEKNNLDPSDYEEELEYFSQNRFYERIQMPSNKSVVEGLMKDLKTVAHIINRLKEYPYRNMDSFNCRGCDYKQLCHAELMGLDTEFIRKKEFKPKEHREEEDGNENIWEESYKIQQEKNKQSS